MDNLLTTDYGTINRMPYLIDGHNLIGKMPDLALSDIDDEMELVARLQAFCRTNRRTAEVFFDKAPAGSRRVRQFGPVKAHFVREGKPADAAIEEFLERLKGDASNWTVVSSDNRVQRAAHKAHAKALSSEDFIRQMAERPGAPTETPQASEREVNEWLRLFGEERE